MKRKILPILLLLVLLGLALYFGLDPTRNGTSSSIFLSGNIELRTINLAFRLPGKLIELMVEEGAIDEVSSLLALNYPSGAPVMKAIGVPQLAGYLDQELSLEEALEKGKAATRQYAKRQSTWFRNSFGEGWKHV